MKKIFLLLNILLLLLGCSEVNKQNYQTYKAGFKTIRLTDKSRLYKHNTDSTDYLHFRPVDVDIWYPAASSVKDSGINFRYLLSLLEKRAAYYTASDAFKGITGQIAQAFCEGFKCSDTSRLLGFRTRTILNAEQASGKFPVIIYMCAFNGMSFENFRLFEEFAEKGYFVISVSSIGRYPGDMTMKNDDLLEQVFDAEFILKHISGISGLDLSNSGVIGYSWGGLSGAILAGRFPQARYLVSLDGSEYHHYGKTKDENEDFNDIKASAGFKDLRLTLPYLRLESMADTSDKADSVYNFSEKLTGEKRIIRIDSASHQDFSCLSQIVAESGRCRSNGIFVKSLGIIKEFIEKHSTQVNP